MYLSRIALDLRNPSVRQALRDCNDMHRNLMQGFGAFQADEAARRRACVLYRLVERRDEISLLVSSAVAPERQALAARGFVMASDSPKDVSGLEQAFEAGRLLRFELLASPCKKVSGTGKNSRRAFLRTEPERMEWLRKKAEQGGFEVIEVRETSRAISIDGVRSGMRIHHDAVTFSGVLRILDRGRFWETYCTGIGPGKAYGMGMLTVARV